MVAETSVIANGFSFTADEMLVWILIAACWIGLLLLILHDVTKDAEGSSPVSIASRRAVLTGAKGWRKLRKLRRDAVAAKALKTSEALKTAVVLKTAEAAEADKPEAPAPTSLMVTPPQATESSRKKWWSKDRRAQITPAELELTITEAVRKSAPGCSSFIGVIVHHRKPRQQRDPNWGVRGVKFGKADRRTVDETLSRIVAQLQKEFRLTDPQLRH